MHLMWLRPLPVLLYYVVIKLLKASDSYFVINEKNDTAIYKNEGQWIVCNILNVLKNILHISAIHWNENYVLKHLQKVSLESLPGF